METRKYKFGEIEKTKLERKIQKGTRVKMEEITNSEKEVIGLHHVQNRK